MRYNTGVSTITNAETNLMTVDPEKAAKVAAMLVNNYTSYVTPVREVIVNGLEAVAGDKNGKVVVDFDDSNAHATSVFSNISDKKDGSYVINITDNGCGMSHDFAKNKFVHLTASSKDTTDSTIGGFGIGAKSVSSISHHTVFRTVQDGIATVIVFGMSDKGATTSVSDPMEVDEPNGTSVSIHVDSDVFYSIIDDIEEQFLNYLDPDTPLEVTSNSKKFEIGSKAENIIYSHTHANGTTVHMVKKEDNQSSSFYGSIYNDKNNKNVIRCVGMPYPMIDSITGAGLYDMMQETMGNVIPGVSVSLRSMSFIVDIQPKDITIDSSRERVADTNHLRGVINDAFKSAMTSYIQEFANKMVSAENGEELLSLIEEGYGFVSFNSRSVLSKAVNMSREYQGVSEDNNDGKSGILVIDGNDANYYRERLMRLDKNSVYNIFDAYRADSISRVLNKSNDVDEALGIDTDDRLCIFVDCNVRNNMVTVGKDAIGNYLPKKFMSRFNDGDEISLPVEIVKWRFGIEATKSEKTYTQIRKSMMARGRTSGKGTSAKKREIFYYVDKKNDVNTVTAGDAKELFEKWEKDGITKAVVFRDNKENIALNYETSMCNLDYTIKAMYGEENVVVFVSAKRCDTAEKNQRILEDKLKKTGIALDTDMLKDKSIHNVSTHVIDGASKNIGYLFFETGLDSHDYNGHYHYDLGIGHDVLDIEHEDETVQDFLADFLLLDKDKYAQERKRISKLVKIREKSTGQGSSVVTTTPSEFSAAVRSMYLAAGEENEKLDDMLADGVNRAQHENRAKALFEVARIVAEKNDGTRYYGLPEIKKAFENVFQAAQEVVDNPDSALARLIMK